MEWSLWIRSFLKAQSWQEKNAPIISPILRKEASHPMTLASHFNVTLVQTIHCLLNDLLFISGREGQMQGKSGKKTVFV